MSIESRLYKLEQTVANLQESFIQSQRNQVPITERTDESHNKIPQVDSNTVGVTDNDLAICDVADLADTNSMAIDDLAELVDELSNKVAEMES
jgi:uncharacterized coiled-coil protein SlyX